MDVRVHVSDASRDYIGGLTVKDIDSIVFDAPGNIVPQVHQKRIILLDLYTCDLDVTVRREYGTDVLIVTFSYN